MHNAQKKGISWDRYSCMGLRGRKSPKSPLLEIETEKMLLVSYSETQDIFW